MPVHKCLHTKTRGKTTQYMYCVKRQNNAVHVLRCFASLFIPEPLVVATMVAAVGGVWSRILREQSLTHHVVSHLRRGHAGPLSERHSALTTHTRCCTAPWPCALATPSPSPTLTRSRASRDPRCRTRCLVQVLVPRLARMLANHPVRIRVLIFVRSCVCVRIL